ncbi:restriction endonuclease subunit S [Enterococcus faecium]|uniref:restriction endonuclease subunit S n=1 Tax=Enterococcus TaxID=1350 RepID=UPI000CF1E54A|nr:MULTISPECIES: restriction endonuclease subunit S [Enterococcus]EGP5587761.1 restriction endonuclease subunit S [Enterococcus faecium]NTJ99478.1 restriction endonuclease subunit S [Enterococcus faecium]NTK14818.1 restriction endonuclease subunit S [Enterococcus faecium]NTS14134.1 restriction endonuclease subunit S [Enterococcus faecium]NTS16645.1 restriction endonuclease subunit S [Enterococcus faecium]
MSNDTQPEIRFPGFTDDWEQRKLSDILILIGGNAFSSSDSTTEGIPWLKIANVDKNGIDWSTQSFLPSEYWGEFPNYQLNKGDYVMALTRPILNHTLKIGKVDKPALLNQRVAKLDFSLDKEFTFQLLQRRTVVDKIDNELAGTDPPNLGSKNLTNIDILITNNKGEQQKIGTFFKQLDNIIALHQRKLDLLKETKKGFLQKMFPKNGAKVPEIRFPGFTEDWEQRTLGDILKEFSIKSKVENEYTVLSSTNSGMEIRNGRVSGVSNLGYKIIENGDLVLSPQNLWLGNININNVGTGLVSPSYKTFKFIKVDPGFIRPQLRTARMLEEYKNSSTQGASVVRRNLELGSFYQITIKIPSDVEQGKIGLFFKQLDNLIALHQRKLDLLKETKKGFLQKMFV